MLSVENSDKRRVHIGLSFQHYDFVRTIDDNDERSQGLRNYFAKISTLVSVDLEPRILSFLAMVEIFGGQRGHMTDLVGGIKGCYCSLNHPSS